MTNDDIDDIDILIFIRKEKLSDGSMAYNVELPEFTLNAVNEDDAIALAETIVDAINHHTVNPANVIS